MSEPAWSAQLAQIGYEAQSKFDFYAVGLIFTLLGLSIQTAQFGTEPAADFFELVGWFSLLVSGLGGLGRLAWQPQVFQLMGVLAGQQARLSGLREARARGQRVVHALDTGTDLSITDMIVQDERDAGKIDRKIKLIEGRSNWSYKVRSIAFLLGIGCLMVARAFEPLQALYRLGRVAGIAT